MASDKEDKYDHEKANKIFQEIKVYGEGYLGKHKWLRIGTTAIIVVVVSVMIISTMVLYSKIVSTAVHTNRMASILESDTFRGIVEKDIRECLKWAKVIWGIQYPLRPVAFPNDEEIKQAAVEMVIGEIRYQIPYKEVLATIAIESFFDKECVGPCGEVGLMQLMEDTKAFMIDELDEPDAGRFNVAQNIRAGIKYKSKCRYTLQYGSYYCRLQGMGRPPTKEEELWGYNAGMGAVLKRKWYRRKDAVYDNVKTYVKKFNFYYENYKRGVFDVYYDEPNKRYSIANSDKQLLQSNGGTNGK